MASGGIPIGGDGKRLLDASGRQILDDSCFTCCCAAGTRVKAIVSGITTHNTPIPNWLFPCGFTDPTKNDFGYFNPFGCAFIGGQPPGDILCAISIVGTANRTYYLSGGGGTTSCTYSQTINPSPVVITLNQIDPVTGRSLCGTPLRAIAATLTASVTYDAVLQLRDAFQITVVTAFIPEIGGALTINMFQNLDHVLGCGYLCLPTNTIANQNVLGWASPVVYSGTGGTAVLTEI